MNAIDCAWAAGFFDGEGCVGIRYPTKKNFCVLIVSVTNTDVDVLMMLRALWGGNLYTRNKVIPNQRRAWEWLLPSKPAERFLADIQPFVRRGVVQRRIALALDFQAQKTRNFWTSREQYQHANFEFYKQMRELNLRGAAAIAAARRRERSR